MPFLLPGLHVLAVRVPEVARQRAHAGVEQVGVLEHLVVEVVLRRQAQRTRLDAHVDVFGHQHDFALRFFLLQIAHHGENLVVGLAGGEGGRQLAVDRLGLQEQAPLRLLPVFRLDRQPVLDVLAGDDLVEEAARLARVARHVREAALVLVELLERGDRQVEVVLVEAEQARRIVHQHVGIEDEELLDLGFARRTGGFLDHRNFKRSGRLLDIIGL
jgi:hypothetical protein